MGNNDLLDFSVADPGAVPAGKTCDYKSFSLEKSKPGPGPENVVTYKGAKGGNWVAFNKGGKGWSINWRGADAVTIEKRSYLIVDVVYERVGAEAGPVVGSS